MKSPKSPNNVKIKKSGCSAVSFAVTQAIAPHRGARRRIKATAKIKIATAISAATSIRPVALSQAGIANKGEAAAEVQSNALRAGVIIVKLLKIKKIVQKCARYERRRADRSRRPFLNVANDAKTSSSILPLNRRFGKKRNNRKRLKPALFSFFRRLQNEIPDFNKRNDYNAFLRAPKRRPKSDDFFFPFFPFFFALINILTNSRR